MACVWKMLHPFSENNKPPKADAGPDKELTLPVDSTTLDGSKSSDDQKIVSFLWEKTRCVSSSRLFLCKYLGLSFKTRHTPTYLPCVKSWSHCAWQALPVTRMRQGFMFNWREVEFWALEIALPSSLGLIPILSVVVACKGDQPYSIHSSIMWSWCYEETDSCNQVTAGPSNLMLLQYVWTRQCSSLLVVMLPFRL